MIVSQTKIAQVIQRHTEKKKIISNQRPCRTQPACVWQYKLHTFTCHRQSQPNVLSPIGLRFKWQLVRVNWSLLTRFQYFIQILYAGRGPECPPLMHAYGHFNFDFISIFRCANESSSCQMALGQLRTSLACAQHIHIWNICRNIIIDMQWLNGFVFGIS